MITTKPLTVLLTLLSEIQKKSIEYIQADHYLVRT